MTRFSRFSVLTLVVVAVAALAPAGSSTVAAAATSSKECPPVSGVKWVAPYAPHPSGTQYDVHVGGKITCTQATGYVKKVVTHHVPTSQNFVGGPRGWTCKASASKSGLAYTGTCSPKSQGFAATDYFAWTVG